MAASGQLSHQVRLDRRLRALVARGGREALHTDGAVLRVAGDRAEKPSALTLHWFLRDQRSGELSLLLFWKAHNPGYMDLWEYCCVLLYTTEKFLK